ncbi:uncharacterized protein [Physcomitrium patens]|uniref:uncharacterized protein n=1 Tax=Physcomitrium patens TaxID=3218 RepID=UPI003CCD98AE
MTSCSAEIVFLIGVRVWALLPRVGKCNLLLFDTKFRFIRRILCQACNRNGCRTDEDKEGRRTNRTMATLMELEAAGVLACNGQYMLCWVLHSECMPQSSREVCALECDTLELV